MYKLVVKVAVPINHHSAHYTYLRKVQGGGSTALAATSFSDYATRVVPRYFRRFHSVTPVDYKDYCGDLKWAYRFMTVTPSLAKWVVTNVKKRDLVVDSSDMTWDDIVGMARNV